MKLLISESQYRGILKHIKDYEHKINFMKKSLSFAVIEDILKHFSDNSFNIDTLRSYDEVLGRTDTSNRRIFDISRDDNGNHPKIRVWVTVGKTGTYVEVLIRFSEIYSDKLSKIKWNFDDSEGENAFYSKIDNAIQKRLSQKYLDKLNIR